jgi:DNA helicase-2/ATP-dependent DNA helicase PcrA
MQAFVGQNREEGREDEIFISDYLADVSLLTDQDSDDDNDTVTMMTIHAAKGLEFPTVFVVGLEENIFPSPMAINSSSGLEEERRLLYVAITRAERHCILTNAQNRFRYGTMQFDVPSRFIADIDKNLLNCQDGTDNDTTTDKGIAGYGGRMPWDRKRRPWETGPRLDNRYQNSQPVADRFMADPKLKVTHPRKPEKPVQTFYKVETKSGELKVGSIIEHERFGVGTITQLEGKGENTKATVDFRNLGRKQLLLKFARFKIIG